MDWLYPLADWLNPRAAKASPISPYIFSYFPFFSNVCFCPQRELYHQNQCTQLLILRSYVDLLNYPLKRAQNKNHCKEMMWGILGILVNNSSTHVFHKGPPRCIALVLSFPEIYLN